MPSGREGFNTVHLTGKVEESFLSCWCGFSSCHTADLVGGSAFHSVRGTGTDCVDDGSTSTRFGDREHVVNSRENKLVSGVRSSLRGEGRAFSWSVIVWGWV